jgi:hypothetical protein
LEGTIQGNKPEEKIVRLEAEIAKAPPEMVPVLQAVLAHWYWHYFQQNRWRFMQRTDTSEPPGDDFTTWSLPQIFAEIDKHFRRALSADELLKQTPVGDYQELLEKGNVPDSYRPTMYDFLAHEALSFYSAGEQAAARPQDAFRSDGRQPDLRALGRIPGLGSGNRRRGLADRPRDPAVPAAVAFPPGRRGSHRSDRRRSAPSGIRLQPGVRRGQERALQGGAGAFHRPLGRSRDRRPGAARVGDRSCSRRASWSKRTGWPSAGKMPFPTASADGAATT